jgi:hypothetical protein
MKKLSEYLQELAERAANTEKKAAAAQQQSQEKVEAAINAAKADAKARQDKFKANVAAGQAAAASDWEKLQAEHNQRVATIKSKIVATKAAVKRDVAMDQAADAEYYAASTIDFALMAIDEAEVATLEAIGARAYAESLA